MRGHKPSIRKKQSTPASERQGEATPSSSSAVQNVLSSTEGKPMDDETRSFMEQRLNYDFNEVKIHDDEKASESADSINALAYTYADHIVFNTSQYNPQTSAGKKLLAHELTHVIQQSGSSNTSKINRQRKQTPHDKQLVDNAKKRLAILKPKLDRLRSMKTEVDVEKTRASGERMQLDQQSIDPGWKGRMAGEESNFSNMNRQPIEIILNNDAIIFKVKFQVFFNNPNAKNFSVLKQSLQAGINLVWNQTLANGVFQGRKFSIISDPQLINSLQDRKADHWLIEVRSSDTAAVTHPGCNLPQPSPGIPTSVTDTLCDNGVMNIPPSHVSKPGIIGHEMLHLFGLFDRYLSLEHVKNGKVVSVDLMPTRNIGKRKDALGGDDGPILIEDLNYLFLKLGVYDREEARTTGMLPLVEKEVKRLERIVSLGYDPDSLIRERTDFNDKVIKSAEDL